MDICEQDGKLIISPQKATLDELLSRVTSENLHEVIETGAAVGKEEW